MKLGELLNEGQVLAGFQARDKWEAIAKLVDLLVDRGLLPKERRKAASDALATREKIASTGMEFGVALPHASVEGLPAPLAVVGLSATGVPFQSPDGQASRIIVLLLIPHHERLQHTATLASIARILSYEETRDALTRARNSREALQIIRDEEQRGT